MRDHHAPTIDSALGTQEMAHEQKALLDLIDKLQFAQLDNVKLPQIVVVGDQSAGKSSVLEAITGTPFPRDAGACTRFATEIRLRRDKTASLTVSIIPDKKRNIQEQVRLKDYGGSVDTDMPFDTLMRQAVELIAPKNIPGRFAARDILVVEKRGPDMPLLTLVDLPGLVRNANRDQSAEDIRTIESLSEQYMRSRRTIILAVVGGNTDYVQAPILTKARQFDPTGARTIGVLTKPDLTESIGLEDKFIELVLNRDRQNHFRLGWYVLLNPGPREPGQAWPAGAERHQKEMEFFSPTATYRGPGNSNNQNKWSVLPAEMCGAEALKRKLSAQLQHHIRRHVKVLRRQIQAALDACEAELKAMGQGKDTVSEMRMELVELFSSSKELVIPAVYGFYKNPPGKRFFSAAADPNGTPAQNLRARAVEENEKFSARVRANGRKLRFSSTTAWSGYGGAGSENGQLQNANFNGQAATPMTTTATTTARMDGSKDNRKAEFVRTEVERLLRQIRGSEFPGDARPRAVYMLFQSYSENWPVLGREHKDNLGIVCGEFLSEVLDYVWPARMRELLRGNFLGPRMKNLMDKAEEELERLVGDMHLEVQPYDPEYEERLQSWRGRMIKQSQAQAQAQDDGGQGYEGPAYAEAQEVLEKMLIYYELSAKSFIRNVITQVVERHLLQGLYGIFNSAPVLAMSDSTVEAIASENKETRERRVTLKGQKKAIEEARDMCAGLAMRKELRAYAEESDGEENTSDEDGSDGYVDLARRMSKGITVATSSHHTAASVPTMGSSNSSHGAHDAHRSQQQHQHQKQQQQYYSDSQQQGPVEYTTMESRVIPPVAWNAANSQNHQNSRHASSPAGEDYYNHRQHRQAPVNTSNETPTAAARGPVPPAPPPRPTKSGRAPTSEY